VPSRKTPIECNLCIRFTAEKFRATAFQRSGSIVFDNLSRQSTDATLTALSPDPLPIPASICAVVNDAVARSQNLKVVLSFF
jgi:hypothetical protein